MNERKWIDFEPGESSFSAYEISKKVINLLRHSQTVQREDDGSVQFWRMKNFLQNQFPQVPFWSDDRWKACLAVGGGVKRRYQYCTDISGTIVHLRALQGHSGRNLIDPTLQDNVIKQSGFLQNIHHIRCAFNLHSIIHNGLIPGGQNSSKRQTVFFLPIDPRDKEHKDPQKIDSTVPRRAQYLHSAWKQHQDAVFWVDVNLVIQKRINILSDSIECNYHSRNMSSLLSSESCEIEDWRSLVRRSIYVSSTTTKDLVTTRSRLDQRESSIGFYS